MGRGEQFGGWANEDHVFLVDDLNVPVQHVKRIKGSRLARDKVPLPTPLSLKPSFYFPSCAFRWAIDRVSGSNKSWNAYEADVPFAVQISPSLFLFLISSSHLRLTINYKQADPWETAAIFEPVCFWWWGGGGVVWNQNRLDFFLSTTWSTAMWGGCPRGLCVSRQTVTQQQSSQSLNEGLDEDTDRTSDAMQGATHEKAGV